MDKLNKMYEKMTVSDEFVSQAVQNAKKPQVIRFPWKAVTGVAVAAVLVAAVTAIVVPMAFGSLLRASKSDSTADRYVEMAEEAPGSAEGGDSVEDSGSRSGASGSSAMSPSNVWETVEAYASPVAPVGTTMTDAACPFAADKAYYDGELLYVSYRGHIEDYAADTVCYVYSCFDDAASAITVNGSPVAPLSGEFVLTLTDGELFGVLELYCPSDAAVLDVTTAITSMDALFADGSASRGALTVDLKEHYTVALSDITE